MTWTVSDIPPQHGRVAIVTGTGGVGLEVARELARAGASVILAGRSSAKGAAAVADVLSTCSNASIRFEPLDLADLESVESFAERVRQQTNVVDLLVNNAGLMLITKHRQMVGEREIQFATNHLGHFALTLRLFPLLLQSADPRVVTLTSPAHRQGKIEFDNLQLERGFRGIRGYGNSKLANLLFAFELDRRARAAGSKLKSMAAHPGLAQTQLFSNGGGGAILTIMSVLANIIGHSPADGALPVLKAATAPDAQSGDYYGPSRFAEQNGPPGNASAAPSTRDAATAARLWEVSEDMTNLKLSFGR